MRKEQNEITRYNHFYWVKTRIGLSSMNGYYDMKDKKMNRGFTRCNQFFSSKTVIALTDMDVK